jgi:hypothetical protein
MLPSKGSGLMIDANGVMPMLIEACPSFGATWLEIRDDHRDDDNPGGRLGYIDAAYFIGHLADLEVAGTRSEFDSVFDAIERLVVEGDDYVQNLGVIGYIEGFQMATVTSRGVDPERAFRPWLRPVSEQWWQRVDRFWAGDATALHD